MENGCQGVDRKLLSVLGSLLNIYIQLRVTHMKAHSQNSNPPHPPAQKNQKKQNKKKHPQNKTQPSPKVMSGVLGFYSEAAVNWRNFTFSNESQANTSLIWLQVCSVEISPAVSFLPCIAPLITLDSCFADGF